MRIAWIMAAPTRPTIGKTRRSIGRCVATMEVEEVEAATVVDISSNRRCDA